MNKSFVLQLKTDSPLKRQKNHSVTSGFNSVVTVNYVDDKTLLLKLKDEVIPNSNKLIEKAKAVATKTKELGALHDKFIAAKT